MAIETELEEKIIAELKSVGFSAREIDLDEDVAKLIAPAIHCRITQASFKDLTMTSSRANAIVSVHMVVKSLKSEKDRRHSIHSLIAGCIGYLSCKKFGLEISPLKPRNYTEITNDDMRSTGFIEYRIDFSTSYVSKPVSNAEAMNFLSVGMEYFLKPGDDVAEAQSIVELDNE
jgi:hypothetical protein